MKTVGVSEAKTHLAQLLDEVEQGEEVTITRHGQPGARLVAAEPARDRERARKAVERIRALASRRGNVDPGTLRDWVESGRRP